MVGLGKWMLRVAEVGLWGWCRLRGGLVMLMGY